MTSEESTAPPATGADRLKHLAEDILLERERQSGGPGLNQEVRDVVSRGLTAPTSPSVQEVFAAIISGSGAR